MKGDVSASLDCFALLFQTAGIDHHAKNDLLVKLIELVKSLPSVMLRQLCGAAAQPGGSSSGSSSSSSSSVSKPLMSVLKSVRLLLVDKETAIRSQVLRFLRYLCSEASSCKLLARCNIDLLVARCLERDSKYVWERMQALKLIRQLLAVSPLDVSRACIAALIAIAEQPKDDFRRVCIDALRELVLLSPAAVCSCNGVRTLVDCILDPSCGDIAQSLTLTLLYLLDSADTRRYIRPSLDLSRLLAVFTDTSVPDSPEKEAQRAAAHKALVMMLRSWTGILVFTHDSHGLRSLVSVLSLPAAVKGSSWAKEAVFDLLFEVVVVVRSADLHVFRMSNHRRHANLLHSYIAAILLAFIQAGLVEQLTQTAMSDDQEYRSVAVQLLTEILRLASDLLPRSFCAHLQALTAVVNTAIAFDDQGGTARRVRAWNMINALAGVNPASGAMLDGRGGALDPSLFSASFFGGVAAAAAETDRGAMSQRHAGGRRESTDMSAVAGSSFDGRAPGQFAAGGSGGAAFRSGLCVHGIKLQSLCMRTDVLSSDGLYDSSAPGGGSISGSTSGGSGSTNPAQSGGSESLTGGALSAPSSHQRRKSRMIHSMRHHMDTQLDDNELSTLLKRSSVLSTKDWRQWDIGVCLQLLEGPLTSPASFAAALKTKFLKRLCSFVRPDKRMFADLDWIVPNMRFVRVAASLLRTMLAHQDGREYQFLVEMLDSIFASLMIEINSPPENAGATSAGGAGGGALGSGGWPAAGANQRGSTMMEDSSSPPPTPSGSNKNLLSALGLGGVARKASRAALPLALQNAGGAKGAKGGVRVFGRSHCTRKLAREYFTLIGILSSTPHGLAYFDKHKLYDCLYSLGKDASRDYLTCMLISSLDFGDKRVRTLLDTWMKSGSAQLRQFALSHVHLLLRSATDPTAYVWTMGLLVSQLHNPEPALRAAVIGVLEEAVTEPACLELLIKKKPPFKELGAAAHQLQLAFASNKQGVDYLHSVDWLGTELRDWLRHSGNQAYVEGLESALYSALSASAGGQAGDDAGAADAQADGSAGGGGSSAGAAGSSNEVRLDDDTPALTPAQTAAAAAANASKWSAPPARSEADEYFFKRIHELPWTAEIVVELPNGRAVALPALCYAFSTSHAPGAAATHVYGPSGGSGSGSGVAGSSPASPSSRLRGASQANFSRSDSATSNNGAGAGGVMSGIGHTQLTSYVVAHILDDSGVPKPFRVDPEATIRARLSVGAGPFASPAFSYDPQSPANGAGVMSPSADNAGGRSHLPSFQSAIQPGTLASPGGLQGSSSGGGLGNSAASGFGAASGFASDEEQRTWARQYFLDKDSCEHVCRPQHRQNLSVDRPAVITSLDDSDSGEIARWNFELPGAAAAGGAPPTPHQPPSAPYTPSSMSARTPIRPNGAPTANSPSASTLAPHPSLASPRSPSVGLGGNSNGSSGAGGVVLESIWWQLPSPATSIPSVVIAPHVYGEMAKTETGCAMLREQGHIRELITLVRTGNAGAMAKKPAVGTVVVLDAHGHTLDQRAALWAVGHIGSSNLGFELLCSLDPELVAYLSDQVLHCPTLSMRGTCFYTLGLLSKCPRGRKALTALGWKSSPYPHAALCVPEYERISSFLIVSPTVFAASWPLDRANTFGFNSSQKKGTAGATQPVTATAGGATSAAAVAEKGGKGGADGAAEDVSLTILTHISNLCNHVTQKSSLQTLRTLRQNPQHNALFTHPALLFETLKLLATYSYHLPARRFLLFDLFSGVVFTPQSMATFDQAFEGSSYANPTAPQAIAMATAAKDEARKSVSIGSPTAGNASGRASPDPTKPPRFTMRTGA